MNQVSLTGIGVVIMVVQTVLTLLNVQFAPGSVELAINGLFAFIGFLAIVFGQLRRKDLSFGLFRK